MAGVRLQREFELSKEEQLSQWYQDQIRKAPADSNFVPRWPEQTCTPSPDIVKKFQQADAAPAAPSLESMEASISKL